MTLLVDECVDSSITSALGKGRHQIITLGDLGLINIKFQDPDVLAQANALNASVLTFNVNHSTELFRQGLAQRSVVLLRKPRWMEVDPFLMLIYDELEQCQQEPTRIIRIGFGLTPPRP